MPPPTEKEIRDLDGKLWVKRLNEALAEKKQFEETTGEKFPESEQELLVLAERLHMPKRLCGPAVDIDRVYGWVLGELEERRKAEAKSNAQPVPDDGEDWAPYDEIKTLYSVSSGRLTKWAGKNPKIRRGATTADCEKWGKPSLRYVYNKRLIYEATERDPDAE